MNNLNLIKYPLITEKTILLFNKYKKYTFIVSKTLNKFQIQLILNELFDINISSINTCILPIKFKKVSNFIGKQTCYKKVYITIKNNKQINNLF